MKEISKYLLCGAWQGGSGHCMSEGDRPSNKLHLLPVTLETSAGWRSSTHKYVYKDPSKEDFPSWLEEHRAQPRLSLLPKEKHC